MLSTRKSTRSRRLAARIAVAGALAVVPLAAVAGPALADTADSVREEVRQRRAIEADRAKHRATIRWLVLVLVAVSGVIALNPSYAAPYATPLGQIVLAGVVLALVAVVAWMASMATHRPVPRFLEADRRSRVRAAAQEEET